MFQAKKNANVTEMAKDRGLCCMCVHQKVVYHWLAGAVADDLEWPLRVIPTFTARRYC